MRIYELGDGVPEVAVVGAIHGDEPCGARAVERLAEADPDVERPVKLVVANEEALERGTRYVDEDLNRVFPGDANADSHERRLAHALKRELRDCTTLSFHSTQSYASPFAILDTMDPISRSVCQRLPIEMVVETGDQTDGRLIAHARSLEVECGLQGTEAAAENAWEIMRHFLAATEVLWTPDDLPSAAEALGDGEGATGDVAAEAVSVTDGGVGEVQLFRFGEPIPKPPGERYEVFVENFTHVPEGTEFAAVDGHALDADADFYPILLSANGYESIFGYAGEHVGTLE